MVRIGIRDGEQNEVCHVALSKERRRHSTIFPGDAQFYFLSPVFAEKGKLLNNRCNPFGPRVVLFFNMAFFSPSNEMLHLISVFIQKPFFLLLNQNLRDMPVVNSHFGLYTEVTIKVTL
uniref:Uncharacterized protein n=1 Tax=Parascaris equorum TaxID=6256 RepID=A0A914R2R1_PAREQ